MCCARRTPQLRVELRQPPAVVPFLETERVGNKAFFGTNDPTSDEQANEWRSTIVASSPDLGPTTNLITQLSPDRLTRPDKTPVRPTRTKADHITSRHVTRPRLASGTTLFVTLATAEQNKGRVKRSLGKCQ